MNTDKAYILGLIIGGGIFGNAEDVFIIRLPYKQWGSYEQNPQRAGQISRDIMSVVSPVIKNIYGLTVSFEATNSAWHILCEGELTNLKADLQLYGIECEGELCQNTRLSGVAAALIDDNLKRRFIAGLADTIGSTARTHRRFTDEVQILSFEIKGFNFSFVCELCNLLYSVNCFPDQILWNHPNFHSANNPYYKQWNKGFKLRIQLDQYAVFGAFAFRTKAESAQENRMLQHQTHNAIPCPEREVRVSPSSVHLAENDIRLPERIRGGHYLHNRHVCAVLGCEHAPYDKVCSLFPQCGDLIIPFPVLYKDRSIASIERVIDTDPIMANRTYSTARISVKSIYDSYCSDNKALWFGTTNTNGYPIAEVIQAIAFIIADENELSGTRPRGGFEKLIKRHLSIDSNLAVEFKRPDLLTPLAIFGNGRGALIGACNPAVYQRLISIAPDNEFKLIVRTITEEDLSNA